MTICKHNKSQKNKTKMIMIMSTRLLNTFFTNVLACETKENSFVDLHLTDPVYNSH